MDALRLEHAPSHTPGGQGVLMRKRGGEAPFFTQRFLSKGAWHSMRFNHGASHGDMRGPGRIGRKLDIRRGN